MTRKKGFTLIELLVVISIIALLIGILLPALGAARRNAQRMESNTRLRGIQQGCVQYSAGNSQAFPGYNPGTTTWTQTTTGSRLQLLAEGNYFTGEYMVSPLESKSVWTTGTVDTAEFSYVLLNVTNSGTVPEQHRRTEWQRYDANTQGPIITDRVGGTGVPGVGSGGDASLATGSVHTTDANASAWRGGVCWNDNHTSFETSRTVARTKLGNGTVNSSDDMFVDGASATGSDALYNFQ